MNATTGSVLHLRAGGVSLVLEAGGVGGPLPVVLHWGRDLGGELDGEALAASLVPAVAHSAVDRPVVRRLLPMPADGWRLRPGLSGARRDGGGWSPGLLVGSLEVAGDGAGVEVEAADTEAGLVVRSGLRLHPGGVVELRHTLRNLGPGPYLVSQLAATLPLPGRAVELLDLTGRWCGERVPQRHRLGQGAWVREGRHGRTGHDAPLVLAAGTPGFGWRSGEVWGLHLGWSGDWVYWAERGPDGHAGIGAGELLGPGEVVLEPGQAYSSPPVWAAYSAVGLDGLSAAFHRLVRGRASHPRTRRPVVLNTWEAVYFDHRLDRLVGLAEVAARLGVERFVLDDGWFGGRRHDAAGLGIESCASGGGRVDLGILARTDRVWASDTNDALERQHIQRWTGLLVPPELVGCHVGPPRAHTTGRSHSLGLRVATALFGHFGIEWDLASASPAEQQALAEAIAFYQRMRPLLHTGEVVRADHPDPAAYLHGVVATDRAQALFAYVQLTASATETPGLARLPGLDPPRRYQVQPVAVAGAPQTSQALPPPWYQAGQTTLSGQALAEVGLPLPILQPEQALLLHLTREAS